MEAVGPVLLSGTVSKVLYENAETGYAVLQVETFGGTVRACGAVPFPASGERLVMKGLWEIHPAHGRQFAARETERSLPEDASGVLLFLLSGVAGALGATAVHRAVERFQGDALRILLEDPLCLPEIPGIAADKALAASQEVRRHLACREVAQWLASVGIPPVRAQMAVKRLGVNAAARIRENPWCLQDAGMDIHFREADRAALAFGLGRTDENRIRAALDWILRAAEAEGDACLPEQKLLGRMRELLSGTESPTFSVPSLAGVPGCLIGTEQFLDEWLLPLQGELSWIPGSTQSPDASGPCVTDEDKSCIANPFQPCIADAAGPGSMGSRLVYAKRMMETEKRVAEKILSLQAFTGRAGFSLVDSDWAILDGLFPWGWDDWQKQVFLDAGTHGVTVITGGPGTGKTTLIRGLVRLFSDRGYEIALTAPTGRAARRMSDATGMEAKTLHRLLEVAYDVKAEGELRFRRNADQLLEADVVIVDEASMLDLPLFDALLQACAEGTRLVLVGDAEQLPSVGVGRVLGDLIDSGRLPVTRLRQVFRQADGSRIAANAQGILEGHFPEFSDEWGEFHLIRRYKAEAVAQTVVQLCHRELPDRYGFNPLTDIQVLTPMRKGMAGVANLNLRLREALNPDGKIIGNEKNSWNEKRTGKEMSSWNEKRTGKEMSSWNEKRTGKGQAGFVFHEGDRVMQIRNDYQLAWTSLDEEGNPISGEGVYNGDMGTLTEYGARPRTAMVVFDDGRQAEYGLDRLDGLEPAYAVTVHKSQGSEYPVVVLPLIGLPDSLACRNLLYTAITRARRMVVIVGTEAMLERMIQNNRDMERHSGLAIRLKEGVGEG